MSKYEKLINKILSGNSDANIAFDDLCELLRKLEFDVRIRGSHHTYINSKKEKEIIPVHNKKVKKCHVKRLINRLKDISTQ